VSEDATKHLGGRPTKLTPELQKKICDAVGLGNYLEVAAAYAGIARSTLYDWIRRGRRAKRRTKYRDFAEALDVALATAEVEGVERITKAGKSGEWQADMTRLERMFPTRWARRLRHQVEGPDGGGIPLEVTTAGPIEFRAVFDDGTPVFEDDTAQGERQTHDQENAEEADAGGRETEARSEDASGAGED
jgi:hypothetical protein